MSVSREGYSASGSAFGLTEQYQSTCTKCLSEKCHISALRQALVILVCGTADWGIYSEYMYGERRPGGKCVTSFRAFVYGKPLGCPLGWEQGSGTSTGMSSPTRIPSKVAKDYFLFQ